jgi:MoaA/NifB/PqqE/SkfB family radical SAM enzyme
VEALRAGDHARQVEDGKRCGRCAWRAVCRPAYRSADADPDGGEDAA